MMDFPFINQTAEREEAARIGSNSVKSVAIHEVQRIMKRKALAMSVLVCQPTIQERVSG